MSHRHSQAVWDDADLSGNAKLLMLKFADNADEATGAAFPGTVYLASKTGISERQIKRLIPQLVKDGKLAIIKDGGGRGKKAVYRVLPALHAKGDATAPFGETVTSERETVTSETVNGAMLAPAQERGGNRQGTVREATPPTPRGVQDVFDAWIEAVGKTSATKLDDKRRRRIERALRDFPLEDVLDAVRGVAHDPFNMGVETGRPYNDVTLVLRDAEHIERFRDIQRGLIRPGNGISNGRANQMAAWVEGVAREWADGR
jgi:hypothetical protein